MFVIGTAGHVDHGKSALVHALTGIDPDRLREEKERGMTIDLGFAWLALPSGREVSIVDVPGHERFIRNMLAGVGGIDLALLVIAADEGVMPQTREHLAILDLLAVPQVIVVLTKRDLVDDDWLELVREDVAELVKGTVAAAAPVFAVSAVTADGLPHLVAAIDDLLAEAAPPAASGQPRLSVDRVFTIGGFGTVVTGTLIGGPLAVGQEVVVLPRGLRARIRGLQSHRHQVERAQPGSRVAINLTGVATADVARGDTVTTPRWLAPCRAMDVSLRLLDDAPRPLEHGAQVSLHLLASQTTALVRLLDCDELAPGKTAWAQLRLDAPLVAVRGDRFIIRSPDTTLGGGEIVATAPRRHRRFDPTMLRQLEAVRSDRAALVLHALGAGPLSPLDLARAATLPLDEVKAVLAELAASGRIQALGGAPTDDRAVIFAADVWDAIVARAADALAAYHRQYNLRPGIPREELRSRLRLDSRAAALVIERLATEGRLIDDGATLRRPDFVAAPTTQQAAAAAEVMAILEKTPFRPPNEVAADPEIVSYLLAQRRVVRLRDGYLMSAAAADRALARLAAHLRQHGQITLAEIRDMFDTTRPFAFGLLDQLDQQGLAKRSGTTATLR